MSESEQTLNSIIRIGVSIHQMNKKTERALGLSITQWCLLRQLVDMPTSSAFSLAKAAGIHPSTLTQSLKRLARKGYLFMTEDPIDSRRKLISLTRLGRQAMEKAGDRMSGWSDALLTQTENLRRVLLSLEAQVGREF